MTDNRKANARVRALFRRIPETRTGRGWRRGLPQVAPHAAHGQMIATATVSSATPSRIAPEPVVASVCRVPALLSQANALVEATLLAAIKPVPQPMARPRLATATASQLPTSNPQHERQPVAQKIGDRVRGRAFRPTPQPEPCEPEATDRHITGAQRVRHQRRLVQPGVDRWSATSRHR